MLFPECRLVEWVNERKELYKTCHINYISIWMCAFNTWYEFSCKLTQKQNNVLEFPKIKKKLRQNNEFHTIE